VKQNVQQQEFCATAVLSLLNPTFLAGTIRDTKHFHTWPTLRPSGLDIASGSPTIRPISRIYWNEEMARGKSSKVIKRFNRPTIFKVCTINFEGFSR
jgi:hypothetical protein